MHKYECKYIYKKFILYIKKYSNDIYIYIYIYMYKLCMSMLNVQIYT